MIDLRFLFGIMINNGYASLNNVTDIEFIWWGRFLFCFYFDTGLGMFLYKILFYNISFDITLCPLLINVVVKVLSGGFLIFKWAS